MSRGYKCKQYSGYYSPKDENEYEQAEYSGQKEAKYGKCGYYGDGCNHEEYDCRRHRCMLPYEAVKEIRAAIDDELGAVASYAELARKFRCNPTLQAWITNIAGDEYGHARAFSMVLAAAGCAEHGCCCKGQWEE